MPDLTISARSSRNPISCVWAKSFAAAGPVAGKIGCGNAVRYQHVPALPREPQDLHPVPVQPFDTEVSIATRAFHEPGDDQLRHRRHRHQSRR
jgi:hypothetical protein